MNRHLVVNYSHIVLYGYDFATFLAKLLKHYDKIQETAVIIDNFKEFTQNIVQDKQFFQKSMVNAQKNNLIQYKVIDTKVSIHIKNANYAYNDILIINEKLLDKMTPKEAILLEYIILKGSIKMPKDLDKIQTIQKLILKNLITLDVNQIITPKEANYNKIIAIYDMPDKKIRVDAFVNEVYNALNNEDPKLIQNFIDYWTQTDLKKSHLLAFENTTTRFNIKSRFNTFKDKDRNNNNNNNYNKYYQNKKTAF